MDTPAAGQLADLARVVVVAHELRNPIGAIRNAVSAMESAGGEPCVVEQASRLIAGQVSQLAVLVEDLLELPDLARGELRVTRRWIDIVPEARAALDSCAW